MSCAERSLPVRRATQHTWLISKGILYKGYIAERHKVCGVRQSARVQVRKEKRYIVIAERELGKKSIVYEEGCDRYRKRVVTCRWLLSQAAMHPRNAIPACNVILLPTQKKKAGSMRQVVTVRSDAAQCLLVIGDRREGEESDR